MVITFKPNWKINKTIFLRINKDLIKKKYQKTILNLNCKAKLQITN